MDENCAYDYSILPSHVITKIFQRLNLTDFRNATRACKSWYYASADPKITKSLTIKLTHDQIFDVIEHSIRKYGKLRLFKLHVQPDDELKNSQLENYFVSYGNLLHELKILDCNFDLIRALTHLKSLRTLSLCNFMKNNLLFGGLDDRIITEHKFLQNLKSLTIRNVGIISDSIKLIRFLSHMDRLEAIAISVKFQTADDYQKFFHLFAVKNWPLRYIYVDFYEESILEYFMENLILADCRKLKMLDLLDIEHDRFIQYRNEKLLGQFFKKVAHLEYLRLGFVNDQMFQQMNKYMKKLKNLQIYFKEHENFDLFEINERLEALRVTIYQEDYCYCPIEPSCNCNYRMTEEPFMYQFLLNFDKLKILDYSHAISERGLSLICQNCPNLEELRIENLYTTEVGIIFQKLNKLRILKFDMTILLKGEVRLGKWPEIMYDGITNLKQLNKLHTTPIFQLPKDVLHEMKNLISVANFYGFFW